jgi:5,6-dimethylbenzimidazole synthase
MSSISSSISPVANPSPAAPAPLANGDGAGNGHAAAAMPEFDDAFRAQLVQLVAWRRDVRRFRPEPLPPGTLERLIETACLAPSVGLSQPWRFVTVDDPARRAAVREEFRVCNADALASYAGDRAGHYAALKLEGLREAPQQFAAAICTMWLAARAQGIGLGWISILDPAHMAGLLDVSPDWRFIGYFCLGYPLQADDRPELERARWERRLKAQSCVLAR